MAPSCSQGLQAATQGARGWTWTSARTPQEDVDEIRRNRGKKYGKFRMFRHLWFICSLVGGIPTILKNMKVNGKDDIPYIMENKSHVTNHQPVLYVHVSFVCLVQKPRTFRSCFSWCGFVAGDKSWNMFGTCSGNAFCTHSFGVWAKLGFFLKKSLGKIRALQSRHVAVNFPFGLAKSHQVTCEVSKQILSAEDAPVGWLVS